MAQQQRRVFVTGTDTDVGKTVVSAILAQGWGARYWKPLQAGTEGGTDSQAVASWLGQDRVLPEHAVLSRPLSPNQAAEQDGVSLELASIQLPAWPGPLVVEGAGGLMVPLNQQHTMLDLMARLGLPVVLVARSGLGTLNHSLLSLAMLKARGLKLLGLILVGEHNPLNQRDIQHFGQAEIIGRVPPLAQLNARSFQQVFDGFQLVGC